MSIPYPQNKFHSARIYIYIWSDSQTGVRFKLRYIDQGSETDGVESVPLWAASAWRLDNPICRFSAGPPLKNNCLKISNPVLQNRPRQLPAALQHVHPHIVGSAFLLSVEKRPFTPGGGKTIRHSTCQVGSSSTSKGGEHLVRWMSSRGQKKDVRQEEDPGTLGKWAAGTSTSGSLIKSPPWQCLAKVFPGVCTQSSISKWKNTATNWTNPRAGISTTDSYGLSHPPPAWVKQCMVNV